MGLLTVAEAADKLRVSKATLYGLIKTGKLPFISVGQATGYRLSLQDLEAYIDCNRKVFQTESRPRRKPLKHLNLN